MKNLNLIKRLLSYSHEKQSPQRFVRYAAMLIMLLTLGVGQVWASTTLTMYYAVDANIVACNTPKVYYNCGWGQTGEPDLVKTAYTYNGKLIYSITVTANHDGFDGIYFKPKGSSDQEQAACTSWTAASTYSGKMYVHGSGWQTYSKDASYTVYFVNNGSWTTPKAYAWNSDCDKNAEYATSGTMTNTGKTYNGKAIWSITFNKRYAKVIFNSNGSSDIKTGDLTLGSTNAGKMFTFATNSTAWIAYNYDVTITFNMKSHGSAPSNITLLKGGTASAPSDPSATGYDFGGWYTDSECTSAWSWSTAVNEDKNLYAKWTEKSYSITFANDGHGTVEVADVAVSSGSTASVNHFTTKKLEGIANTGYHFSSWTKSGTNNDKVTIGDMTSTGATTTIKATATGATVTANFAANTYSVTLHDNNGGVHNGSATATYDANSIDISSVPTRSGYEVEGYYLSDGTTKVANADGTLVAGVSDYTDGSGNWIQDDDCTLYAHWSVVATTYTLYFAPGTDYTSMGSVSATVGGSPASSGSAYNENSAVVVTASPNAHYRVAGWYSDAACSSEITGVGAPGTATSYSFSLTGITRVYVKFESAQTAITLDRNTGTSGDESVTATHGNALPSFTAHAKTGYTLNGYFTESSGGTKIINADGTLVAGTAYATSAPAKWNSNDRTLTLHAQWTEIKQTISTSVRYDAGSSTYTATAANQVGVTTTSTITASEPVAAHYTFAGWELTNLTLTAGNPSTDKSITVRVTDAAVAPVAVAKYNEVLTQNTWVLKGGSAFGGTAWSTEHAMAKKSGESTSDIVYAAFNISATNTGAYNANYNFKIVKKGSPDLYFGIATDKHESEWWYNHDSGEQTMSTGGGDHDNVQLRANAVGEYVVKLDYSNPSAPKVTVEFPSQFLRGDWDEWTEHLFDKDGYVRVNLAASKTYNFQVKYKSEYYKNTSTITATTYDKTFSTDAGSDCKITTTTAGYYVFGWNGATKQLSVIYPSDTTKCKLVKDEYIYFDTRRLTSTGSGWHTADFSTRFWLKNYASAVDYGYVDCALADVVEEGVYCFKVPAENLGQIQINRYKPDYSEHWCTADKVYTIDRDEPTKNCLIEETGKENYCNSWTPQWSATTYCPPMKTAVLEDNGTTILSGAGTEGDPYLIEPGTSIKVTAASSTAFNDDAHMTHNYLFSNGASPLRDQTDATYEFTASASAGTNYVLTVKPYNTYNGQSSTKTLQSTPIYYRTVATYSVTYYANGATGGTVPTDANKYIAGNTVTVLGNTGSLTKEGYTFNGWNEAPDGSGASHVVNSTFDMGAANVVLYAQWADDHNYYFSGATDADWNKASNWTKGAVPNDIANTIYILKPVEITAGTTIKAAAVNIVTGGTYTRPDDQGTVEAAGHLSIAAGAELIISGALRRVADATAMATKTNTREDDLHIGSDETHGNGALVMGTHDGTNQAIVEFYTKSHGEIAGDRSYAKNQFVGTPFNDCNEILYNYHNSWVYEVDYNGALPAWKRINAGDGMEAFKGYDVISADPVGHVYWMGGTLVASDNQSIDLQYKGGSTAANENVLANSWVAPIQISAFLPGDFVNADATIYIFNSGSPQDVASAGDAAIDATTAGQWITIPISSGSWGGKTPTVQVIPSMQSFSVYSTEGSATLALNYNRLVYTPAVNGTAAIVPNRAPKRYAENEEIEIEDPEVMRLFVSGESGFGDNVIMLAHDAFTNDFDNGWDGRKVEGESVAPQMAALTFDGKMAYNCVPEMEGTIISFVKGNEDANYTFSFEYEGENIWYLNDQKEQKSTLISEMNKYEFTSSNGDNIARFVISRTPIHKVPTGMEDVNAGTNARKQMINGVLYIIRDGRIYNAEGALVK